MEEGRGAEKHAGVVHGPRDLAVCSGVCYNLTSFKLANCLGLYLPLYNIDTLKFD